MPWPFKDAPTTPCITCEEVLNGAPILIATHYADDNSWAFLDGEPHDPDDAYFATLEELLALHPDLAAVADLKPGWTAFRETPTSAWERDQD